MTCEVYCLQGRWSGRWRTTSTDGYTVKCTRSTRAGTVHCACVSHSSDCVRLCVHLWCPVLREVRCAESPHTGLSQRAFHEGETPPTARPHTKDSPLPRPLCAACLDPEPLALFPLDNNSTETSERLCQLRSLGLPCGASSLSSTKPDHFGPGEHTRHGARDTRRNQQGLCPRQRAPCREVSRSPRHHTCRELLGSALNNLYHRAY